MKILHLISQYEYTKVYKELLLALSSINDVEQTVAIPCRKKKKIDINNMPSNIKYIVKKTYNYVDRIMYFPRLLKTMNKIKEDVNSYDVIHAHTLFADGGVAYLLNKKHHVGYVVTIRSTDVNEYLRIMKHSKILLNKILLNAKRVVFLSYGLKEELFKHLNAENKALIEEKVEIIPNGVNDFWHNNLYSRKTLNKKEYGFIQVSELIKRKNIDKTMDMINVLNRSGIRASLTIVGGGKYAKKYLKYMNKKRYSKFVKFVGIVNKEKVIKLYRNADFFIMPSINETFGLVYIEALTQGLPIIYTKGTGVDKYFKEYEVGFSVAPKHDVDIKQDLIKVIKNYNKISKSAMENSKKFKWSEIANRYIEIYYE